MKHILTITLAFFTLSLTGLSTMMASSAVAESVVAEAKTDQETRTFAIDNMTCATCPITVRKAMKKVVGVEKVKVDFDAKIATVTFDPSRATPEAIAAASTNAGYPAHVTREN